MLLETDCMNTIVLSDDLFDISVVLLHSAFQTTSSFTADEIIIKHCLLCCSLVFKQIVDGVYLSVYYVLLTSLSIHSKQNQSYQLSPGGATLFDKLDEFWINRCVQNETALKCAKIVEFGWGFLSTKFCKMRQWSVSSLRWNGCLHLFQNINKRV